MLGEEPETVYTSAHAHDPEIAELNDADTVFMQLKFPSGALGHIELGRDARYGYDQVLSFIKIYSNTSLKDGGDLWRKGQSNLCESTNRTMASLESGRTINRCYQAVLQAAVSRCVCGRAS